MKKSKAISFLLSLSLLVSTVIPGTLALPAYASEGPNKGMEISKTATPNEDGTYTITLEAYATGEKISTEVTKDVPTDIVLVLDQSGSMDENMNTYGFRAYTNKSNSDYYNLRHNGASNPNLYYKLEDGSYATVSVLRTQGEGALIYNQCPSNWKNSESGWRDDPPDYWEYANNLFVKDGEEYKKVELDREWTSTVLLQGYYTYTYKFPDGSTIQSVNNDSVPDFGDKGPLYYLTSTPGEYTYTYTYSDKDGVAQTIGTSNGANAIPTEFTLYERYSTGSVTRLSALKTAVTGFSNAVAQKAAGEDGLLGTEDDVDHRIAVVGFAYGSKGYNDDPAYTNTELFIGSNQYGYGNAARDQYANAFQSMKTTEGQANVTASIGALTANGATYVDCGMEIANGVLNANPVPAGEKRNRIVIVFTDGAPGWSGYESDVANSAITQANTARDNGANVYSVGIFDGADATSAGNQNGNDTQKANWFMQHLSDNKGTPQTPSYYLSAADSNTLNNIFEQIADNIESGGSSTTLDEKAVIKDIISPQFQLPAGATANDITLETYKYINENQWEKNTDAMGATATVNGGQVNVTGFNFKENWCGTETANGTTTYRGNKLVISFPVVVKDGFLGGNGVYTNTSAGVYENSTANDPLFTFERPNVDVEIKDITVTAEDKNVYLLGDLTADQIKDGVTVDCGGVAIDLSKANENYGLETWQNAYVNIEVAYKDKDGNTVTDLNDLTDDTTYTVSVNVSPKTTGAATEQTGNGEGKINVFKPELTFKDSDVYYGDNGPTDYSGNLISTKWFHTQTVNGQEVKTEDQNVTMVGAPDVQAPVLSVEYTPDASKIKDGKINTKDDIPVAVDVKILGIPVNDYITFVHQACDPACDWNETELNGNPAFLLHVKTCTLTVQKIGGDSNEPYVFDVMKNGEKYSEVTVKGNNNETIVELPVGEYTIQEKTDWSWRYNASYGAAASLTAQNSTGTVTCTNTKSENYWLNGFSDVVKNIFGVKH